MNFTYSFEELCRKGTNLPPVVDFDSAIAKIEEKQQELEAMKQELKAMKREHEAKKNQTETSGNKEMGAAGAAVAVLDVTLFADWILF